ncbi:type II secretion system protein H [Thalassovita gelatinovora]|uniref:Type II secretion system protein H n=1 Tax=Thalassovita gelatinovora TaxID=53501 RepID=A0A0P1F6F3_THAGE|nr:prepilin-type N-terminal cleavage/methylation domain-containing protein [Thalassovita gelatinovora]QIZ80949.1 prepilin-type N-terminal cleavage/methylation domain-containing protein [Thalassovita gelatinovora]CUH63475.1 type II secretion system protein H [Thalassovita gelatinovora]SEQ67513.1 type II secretion system protein H [Thalassovita gelatinovora]
MGCQINPRSRAKGNSVLHRVRDAGFTLIELLIAVAIMAILAVGVSLSAARGPQERSDLALFREQFNSTQALAIAGGQSRGVQVSPRGLQMAQRTAAGWQVSDRVLRWRGRVSLRVPFGTEPGGRDTPDLVFLATGQVTEFDIVFADRGRVESCHSDGWTGLICDAD